MYTSFAASGHEAFIGGYSVVVKDALPFCHHSGKPCQMLRAEQDRNEAPRLLAGRDRGAQSRVLASALFKVEAMTQALERIRAEVTGCKEVTLLVDFIESSKRGVVK